MSKEQFMDYWVYILRCADGTLYTGVTTDTARRVDAHNSGKGAKYTRSRIPVELIYREMYGNKSSALRRELEIKRLTRTEKLRLVAGAAGGERSVPEIMRCAWAGDDELYQSYHDNEWGRPVHDDIRLFELLILEGMQAGLSWITILRKRENFRRAFDNFNVDKVIEYDGKKVEALMMDAGIIRNRRKIESAVENARAFRGVREEYGSFDAFLWAYVAGTPIQNRWSAPSEVPATTELSDKISRDLKKRGFKFVGSTIVYALMQSIGMVNDHTTDCFCYRELGGL